MKLLILIVLTSVEVFSEDLPLSKYFFPGNAPKLVQGVLQIQGHYLESEMPPMAMPPNFRLGQTFESKLSRFSENRKPGSQDNLPRNFGLPALGQTSTVLYAQPPLCVACYCLQEYQSCVDVGGIQLVTVNTAPSGDYNVPTLLGDGLTCAQNLNYDYYSYSDITTITCIKAPSATLSACDEACRTNSSDCVNNPSYDNCPQITAPAVCGTACANLKINATVPCSPAASDVVSARPTTACKELKKRETSDRASSSSSTPQLESSIGKPSRYVAGRGFIAAVITRRVPGKVTATYVARDASCLPSNVLSSPNCN